MTDTITRVTNIFSLATKNSCLVATFVTRFLYDLDLNLKLKQIFHVPNCIIKASLPPNNNYYLYQLVSAIFSNGQLLMDGTIL